jgi:hypothetical protein
MTEGILTVQSMVDGMHLATMQSFLVNLKVRFSFPSNTIDDECKREATKHLDLDREYRIYNYFTVRDDEVRIILCDLYNIYFDARQFSPAYLHLESSEREHKRFRRSKRWGKFLDRISCKN